MKNILITSTISLIIATVVVVFYAYGYWLEVHAHDLYNEDGTINIPYQMMSALFVGVFISSSIVVLTVRKLLSII